MRGNFLEHAAAATRGEVSVVGCSWQGADTSRDRHVVSRGVTPTLDTSLSLRQVIRWTARHFTHHYNQTLALSLFTLFKICHSMLSTEWQDRAVCLSLVATFFQNISLPLIGWHSCQLSACSPCSPGQCWTCSVTTWTIQLSKTKFPSRFVQKIKGVDGQCKSHVRVWLSNF